MSSRAYCQRRDLIRESHETAVRLGYIKPRVFLGRDMGEEVFGERHAPRCPCLECAERVVDEIEREIIECEERIEAAQKVLDRVGSIRPARRSAAQRNALQRACATMSREGKMLDAWNVRYAAARERARL